MKPFRFLHPVALALLFAAVAAHPAAQLSGGGVNVHVHVGGAGDGMKAAPESIHVSHAAPQELVQLGGEGQRVVEHLSDAQGHSTVQFSQQFPSTAGNSDGPIVQAGTMHQATIGIPTVQTVYHVANLTCEAVECTELRTAFAEAVEEDQCRSLFDNGKCPSTCAAALKTIVSNVSWSPCVTACTDDDVVLSGAERWVRLCDARTESLIDQGKEAVKSLVSDGLASRLHAKVVLQFFLGVLILVLGVGYGYRRGSISAQMAYYARHKRRRIARKNSDANIPL